MELLYSRRGDTLLIQLPEGNISLEEKIRNTNLKGPIQVYPHIFGYDITSYTTKLSPAVLLTHKDAKVYLRYTAAPKSRYSTNCSDLVIRIDKKGNIHQGCSDCRHLAERSKTPHNFMNPCWSKTYDNGNFTHIGIDLMEKQLENNPYYSPIPMGLVTPQFLDLSYTTSADFSSNHIKYRRETQSKAAKHSWLSKKNNAKYCSPCAANVYCPKNKYINKSSCSLTEAEIKDYVLHLIVDKDKYWEMSTCLENPVEFWFMGRKFIGGHPDRHGNFIVSRKNIKFRQSASQYYLAQKIHLAVAHELKLTIPKLPSRYKSKEDILTSLDSNYSFILPKDRFKEFGIVCSKNIPKLEENILVNIALLSANTPDKIYAFTYKHGTHIAHKVASYGAILSQKRIPPFGIFAWPLEYNRFSDGSETLRFIKKEIQKTK